MRSLGAASNDGVRMVVGDGAHARDRGWLALQPGTTDFGHPSSSSQLHDHALRTHGGALCGPVKAPTWSDCDVVLESAFRSFGTRVAL